MTGENNKTGREPFAEQDAPLTKEEALYFLNTPSERNKQKAFLIYYGEERNEEPQAPLQR